MKKLTVGYSTLASRLENISPPKSKEIETVIAVQKDKDIKAKSGLLVLSSMGVTKSRNAVIDATKTEYLLFADDDIEINLDGVMKAIEYLDNHPEVSVLTGMVSDGEKPRKNYPSKVTRLNKFNSAKSATPEMMIRVSNIKAKDIYFDESFGAGSENYLGDEYIFVSDAISKGLKAHFVPITLSTHASDSSGTDWSEKSIQARARVFSRVFGGLALFAKLGFGIKNFKNFGFRNFLRFLFTG